MSNYKIELEKELNLDKDVKIAIITWSFNYDYGELLEKENTAFLNNAWFKNIDLFKVPWAFELPWFARKLLEKWEYDLILCLWIVVRWDTPHFDYVCGESARWIMDLSMIFDTPIINWIITCNTFEQVKERINSNYSISGLNLLNEVIKI